MAVPLSITFPLNPPFVLDFSQYARREQSPEVKDIPLYQKVEKIGLSAIDNIKFFFIALSKSTHSTLSSAGISFKLIVLGYYGNIADFRPSADIYLVAFKVVYWVLGMACCIATTTVRLVYEHNKHPESVQNYVTQFISPEIDVRHIKTKKLAIDVSEVPPQLTVNNLLASFEQIDFNDHQSLHFMARGSRQEGTTTYTPDELKLSLKTFIDNINGRVPFLGTPPAYDTPRLMAFYQQIEDAVRFSLHQVAKKCAETKGSYEQFLAERNHRIPNEGDPDREAYDSVHSAYKNSFEDQARICLNLAIAGKHCGARYMGEAMELYDSLNLVSSLGQATLEEALVEILAAKRNEIAREQIQRHFRNNTHQYNAYMSSLGHILAIPGTENVIEHLSGAIDRGKYIKLFFKKYTVDCIISTINDKVKGSQALREKITDWLRDNPGDWNAEVNEQVIAELIGRLTPLLALQQADNDYPLVQSFLRLQQLITHLNEMKVPLPERGDDGDAFITELFALESATTWFKSNLPGNIREKAQIKQEIKSLFTEGKLGQELTQKVKDAMVRDCPLQVEHFSHRFLALQKVKVLSKHLTPNLALRVALGEKDLREAIMEAIEQSRGPNFLQQLIPNPEGLEDKGLLPEILEWILVSQKVLTVQGG